MQRITLQIICYKSNIMLCKKRKMETSVKKFLKKWPHNHVFLWVLWLFLVLKNPGGFKPPFPVGTPLTIHPQKPHHKNIHTHQLLICLTSHFTFYLDQILSSYPADLCFIIFHWFEFVSIKDLHSDLEQKSFIRLKVYMIEWLE